MFTSTAFTAGSAPMIFSAAATAAGSFWVPMSRKFAGMPPSNWMASIVAIARPAPFTRQPMLPSSFT